MPNRDFFVQSTQNFACFTICRFPHFDICTQHSTKLLRTVRHEHSWKYLPMHGRTTPMFTGYVWVSLTTHLPEISPIVFKCIAEILSKVITLDVHNIFGWVYFQAILCRRVSSLLYESVDIVLWRWIFCPRCVLYLWTLRENDSQNTGWLLWGEYQVKIAINSLWPCDTIWRNESKLTFCSSNEELPNVTKPLSQPLLTHHQIDLTFSKE